MRKPSRKSVEATAVIAATGGIGGAIGLGIGLTTNLFVPPSRPTPGQARFASHDAKLRTGLLRAACDLNKQEKAVRKALARVDKAAVKQQVEKEIRAKAELKITWLKYSEAVMALDKVSSEYGARAANFCNEHHFNDLLDENIVEIVEQGLHEWEADAEKLIEEIINDSASVVSEEAPVAEEPRTSEPTEPSTTPEPPVQVPETDAQPVAAPSTSGVTPLQGGTRHVLPTAPLSKRQQKRIAARDRAQRVAREKADAAQATAEKVVGEAV